MPRISEFYGIVITMYTSEHPPPHFHAKHGGDDAVIAIETGEILAGSLPRPQLRLVRQWLKEHRSELRVNWSLVRSKQQPNPIAPLR
jgi:hypothetical protein